ncbi:hypothetical protein BU16DRAFT_604012 [Lophium mytilinum]|uniref:Uncharacterized protein n=1 Tax=Lophium mytilinum TaxID=390894 RepID=A0A6A6R5Q7_9PEZI|nr:hypothetical protein BU16DRAFT_604012 [Lophium mytilinum]
MSKMAPRLHYVCHAPATREKWVLAVQRKRLRGSFEAVARARRAASVARESCQSHGPRRICRLQFVLCRTLERSLQLPPSALPQCGRGSVSFLALQTAFLSVGPSRGCRDQTHRASRGCSAEVNRPAGAVVNGAGCN